jgi:Bacterial regulatory helix-turn-helix protein, lysR family
VELRDLRAFATTVEVGAITRAADRLHLVQSAVSQAVKRLERELGVVLLERRPDGARPTEAGALFAEHARLIVNAAAHAKRDMNAFGELARGTVRVGVLYAAVPTILAPLLRAAGAGLPRSSSRRGWRRRSPTGFASGTSTSASSSFPSTSTVSRSPGSGRSISCLSCPRITRSPGAGGWPSANWVAKRG